MKIKSENITGQHAKVIEGFLSGKSPDVCKEWLASNMNELTPEVEEELKVRMIGGDLKSIGNEPNFVESLQESMYQVWLSLGGKPLDRTDKNLAE